MPDEHGVHVSKTLPASMAEGRPSFVDGDVLLSYELATTPTGVSLTFTAHPHLRDFFLYIAQQRAVEVHGTEYHMGELTATLRNSGGRNISVTDGLSDRAYNFDGSAIVRRSETPNLRLDREWLPHLGFLRLTAGGLTRSIQITDAAAMQPDQWLIHERVRPQDYTELTPTFLRDYADNPGAAPPITRLERRMVEALTRLRYLTSEPVEGHTAGSLIVTTETENN